MITSVRRVPVLAFGIAVGLALGGAQLAGGAQLWAVAIAAFVPVAYGLVVTLLARSSESAAVLAGRPVDEWWDHVGMEAGTWAFGASAVVVLAALVLVTVQDGDWLPYALIGAVMGLAYAGSLVVLRLRH